MEILSLPPGKNSSRPQISSSLSVNTVTSCHKTRLHSIVSSPRDYQNLQLNFRQILALSLLLSHFSLLGNVTPPGSEGREGGVLNAALTGARRWPRASWVSGDRTLLSQGCAFQDLPKSLRAGARPQAPGPGGTSPFAGVPGDASSPGGESTSCFWVVALLRPPASPMGQGQG